MSHVADWYILAAFSSQPLGHPTMTETRAAPALAEAVSAVSALRSSVLGWR